jgi:hypothetical protein
LSHTWTLKWVHKELGSASKVLGHDNLPIDFFQENVEGTALMLLAFRAMLFLGLTSTFINKGTITLIPKSDDHFKLGYWWPITLLSSITRYSPRS